MSPRPTPRPRVPGFARVLSGSAAVALALGCGRRPTAAGETPPDGPPVVAVRTACASTASFTETASALGTVVPRIGHLAAVAAPAPGRIARVYVAVGQRVSRGQRLVELDQATFRAAAQSAEAALAAAAREAERVERLWREGILPRKDVDRATADLAKARADAVTARRAAQLSVLRAPISGVVTRMAAALGASADPAQPLLEIADPAALDLVLNLPPAEAGRVRPGAAVTVLSAEGGGDAVAAGTVVDVAAAVDSISRTVAVRARLSTVRRALRIGEAVVGRITIGTRDDAVTVPVEALVPDGEALRVFVIDRSGRAQARRVTVGGRTERVAEITSGLAPGECVVTDGAYGLVDGARVLPPGR